MKINKNINGFTIVELLVAITIIIILIIWSNNISFKYVNDKQKLEIFTNKIISEIERIRNNSLVWKWIWVNLNVPKLWKIEFNSWWNWTSSWNVITSYYSWSTWIQENKLIIDKNFALKNINCIAVDWNINILTTAETWAILFEWWKYSLTWCVFCPSNYSNIEIETMSKLFTWSINFDIVSWLIKK